LQMGGVVMLFIAALFINLLRHSHAHGLWDVVPVALSMVCLTYALFRPTDRNMGISAITSAATLLYALVI
jgi:hypothetical protein